MPFSGLLAIICPANLRQTVGQIEKLLVPRRPLQGGLLGPDPHLLLQGGLLDLLDPLRVSSVSLNSP